MNSTEACDLFDSLVDSGMPQHKAVAFVDGQLEADYRAHKVQKAEERLKKIEENLAWCIQAIAKLTVMVTEMKSAPTVAAVNAPAQVKQN